MVKENPLSPEVGKGTSVPQPSQKTGKPPVSQLVIFEDRMTYTFAIGKEVGSIHFDRMRREIFYKGHNVRNMDLEEWQWQLLDQLRQVLAVNENGKPFLETYNRTLDKVLLEKKNQK